MLRKMFRIQYTSDLHLELYKTLPAFSSLLQPCAPYLALAGDIGHPAQLKELFAWAAPQWKRIFYVAGNHEYYGSDYTTRHAELQEIAAPYPNLHFLHTQSPSVFCEEENVAVIGTTLWTQVSKLGDWRSVSDYSRIRFKGSTFAHLNAQHQLEKRILDAEITRWTNLGAQICVITHHMPSFRLIHPKYEMSTINDCFASHCDALMRPPVRLWIYGHTHSCSNQVLGKTLCLCNAKGYLDEDVPGWRPNVWMEIAAIDGQEGEAIAKKDQTPLRTDTYAEDSEIVFL